MWWTRAQPQASLQSCPHPGSWLQWSAACLLRPALTALLMPPALPRQANREFIQYNAVPDLKTVSLSLAALAIGLQALLQASAMMLLPLVQSATADSFHGRSRSSAIVRGSAASRSTQCGRHSGGLPLHVLTRLQEPEEGLLCLSLRWRCLILASCGQQPVYELASSQHYKDLCVVWALRPSHRLLCKGHRKEVPWTKAEAVIRPGTDALINPGLGFTCRISFLVLTRA